MYMIKNIATGKLVARSGSKHSYTRDIKKVRVFANQEDAEGERCPDNETVVEMREVR